MVPQDLRYTKDHVTIHDFYALEGGMLPPGPTGITPDGGVTHWYQHGHHDRFTGHVAGPAPAC